MQLKIFVIGVPRNLKLALVMGTSIKGLVLIGGGAFAGSFILPIVTGAGGCQHFLSMTWTPKFKEKVKTILLSIKDDLGGNYIH